MQNQDTLGILQLEKFLFFFFRETSDRRPLLRFIAYREPSHHTIDPNFQSVRSSISSVPSTNRNSHISKIIDQTPLPEVMYNDTQLDECSALPTFSQIRAPSELNEITKVAFQVDRW